MCIVFVKTSAEELDVNMEPNKQTVLIRCAKDIEIALENVTSRHYGVDVTSSRSGDKMQRSEQETPPVPTDFSMLAQDATATSDDIWANRWNEGNRSEAGVPPGNFNQRRPISFGTPISNNFNRSRPESVNKPTPKRLRVAETNQPKLEFFWKEGSEMKSSLQSGTNCEPAVMPSDNSEHVVPALPSVVFLEPGEERTANISLTDLPSLLECDRPENFGCQAFFERESDSPKPDTKNPIEQTPISWARGNCVTDPRGKFVSPVTIGRPVMLPRD